MTRRRSERSRLATAISSTSPSERALVAAHAARLPRRPRALRSLFVGRDYLGRDPRTVDAAEVDAAAVRAFLAAARPRGLGKRSQGRALAAVRRLLPLGGARRRAAPPPPAGVVRTPKAPQRLPRHLRPARDGGGARGRGAGDERAARAARPRARRAALRQRPARRRAGVARLARPRSAGARAARRRQGRQGADGAVRRARGGGAAGLAHDVGGRAGRGCRPRRRHAADVSARGRAAAAAAAEDEMPVFLNARGGRLTDRSVRRILDRCVAQAALATRSAPAHAAPQLRDASARARAPTCAPSRSCSVTARSSTTQRYTHVDVERLLSVYREAHPRAKA